MGSLDDRDRLGAELKAEISPVVLDALARRAVDRSRRALLDRQHSDGHWSGSIQQQPALEADYILLQAWLGRLDSAVARRCGEQLIREQRAHGGWSLDPTEPPHLSATVKAYFALKLLGHALSCESLTHAREAIRGAGGVHQADSLTHYWLALLGQLPYSDCDALPVEGLFGPRWLPRHIGRWGARARQILAPLSIVWAHRPVRAVPTEMGIAELFEDPLAIKLAEHPPIHGLRGLALRRATDWILERLAGSEGLGANFHSVAWSWLALQCQGFNDRSPEWRQCQEQLDELLIERADTCQVRQAKSTVRDTALAIQALAAAGVSANELRMQHATRWLLTKEVTRRGDWARRSSVEPSGWFRELHNEFYPDVESTVAVLTALGYQFGHGCDESAARPIGTYTDDGDGIELSEPIARRLGLAVGPASESLVVLTYGRFAGTADAHQFFIDWSQLSAAFERGRSWLLALQSRDGGWGSFDRDGSAPWLAASPFADVVAVEDPSDPRLTGQVLRLLGDYDQTRGDRSVDRAIAFLERSQRRDGAWVDPAGRMPVATTAAVLAGLQAVEQPTSAPLIQAGMHWLLARQDSSGGWCERSHGDLAAPAMQSLQPPAAPTPTAWAILGLLRLLGRRHPALRRAVAWLVDQQQADGGWHESPLAAPGGHAEALPRRDPVPSFFPLLALGAWAKSR